MHRDLVFLIVLLVISACDSSESRQITATCNSAKSWLRLSNDEYGKCLQDTDYRKTLVARRNELMAQQLVESHNRDLKRVLPREGTSGYVRLSRISELPLNGIVNLGEEAERHIGERYVIAGTLSSAPNDESDNKLRMAFHADADPDPKDFLMLSTDPLNQCQQTFLAAHCWMNMGHPSSLCRGEIYISIRRAPDGFLIGNELDGAELAPATLATVLSSLSN